MTIHKLNSVLINVPLSSPLHPKANMPFLKGYITQKGFTSRVFDTNISFFHWMLKGYEFDIHDQIYIDNPVSLLALYNKIEDWLSEECKKYTGLRVDLRTIGFAYNRTCFSDVLKAIKDLTQQMGRVGDENVSNLADSVIQLCDQLLREPQK